MNIKKSVNIALANKELTKHDLSKRLGVSRARLYAMLKQQSINTETLHLIAKALDMKTSELIALGE